MTSKDKIQLGAIGLAALILIINLFFLGKLIFPPKQNPTDSQTLKVQAALTILDQLCLSNYSESEQGDVKTKMSASLQAIGTAAAANHSQDVTRGADKSLTEAGQLKD
jgi:hypothetical protein